MFELFGITFYIVGLVLAPVLSMFIGYFWYSNSLFGRAWQKMVNLTDDDLKNADMAMTFGGTIIAAFFQGLVLNVFIFLGFAAVGAGQSPVAVALGVGFLAWMGFIKTTMATNMFYEQRRKKLLAINAGYQLVNVLAASLVFGLAMQASL